MVGSHVLVTDVRDYARSEQNPRCETPVCNEMTPSVRNAGCKVHAFYVCAGVCEI